MLGIGHPDRHALPRITLSKTHQPCRALPPARAGSFFGAKASSGRQRRRVDLRLADDYSGVVETATPSISNATREAMIDVVWRWVRQGEPNLQCAAGSGPLMHPAG